MSMRKHLPRRLAGLALAITSLGASFTAAAAPPLDLAEAYRLAVVHDATIQVARSTALAAQERIAQARAQYFPSISANFSRARNDLETTVGALASQPVITHDRYTSSGNALNLRQPLFRKELGAQLRQAEAGAADANATLERDEQALVMRVTQAYFEVLAAGEQLALVGVQKAAYSGQVDAAGKGLAGGTSTRTDIDEAQSRLDLAIAQELEARQNLAFARQQLQLLVNQPVDEVKPVADAKLSLEPHDRTLAQWTRQADAASPEIIAALAQVEAARAAVEKAQAGHYPALDLTGQVSRSNSENITRVNSDYNHKQIGVQLAVPIFQGGYVNALVREALALQQRAEHRVEELRRDLSGRVYREYRAVTEGVLRIKALEQAVRSARQLTLSSQRSFLAGVRTRIDILNAEQQLGTARRELANARFAYLVGRVRLGALAGEPKEENIQKVNAMLGP
jgi:outer membrane protein/protease secretion system outer membrane protein